MGNLATRAYDERVFNVAAELAQGEVKEKNFYFKKFLGLGASAVLALGGAASIVAMTPLAVVSTLTIGAYVSLGYAGYSQIREKLQHDKNFDTSMENKNLYPYSNLTIIQSEIKSQIENASDSTGVKQAIAILRNKFLPPESNADNNPKNK